MRSRNAIRGPGARNRGVAAVALIAAIGLVASACSSSGGDNGGTANNSSTNQSSVGSAAPSNERGGSSSDATLTLANAVEVDTLDPATLATNEAIWMDQILWSRLVRPNEAATKILPSLATDWDVSDDQLTYTFHMRQAKFSDGSPITAEDAAFSINRAKVAEHGSGFLLTAVKSVEATDDSTLVIKLSKPHEPLLADLADYAFAVLPKAQVEKYGDDFFTRDDMVTSGPFKMESYKPDSEVVMTRNDNYFGKKPNIGKFVVKIIPNDNSRVLALQSGDVDIIENPPVAQRDQIDANPNLSVQYYPSTRVDLLFVNHRKPKLSSPQARQAIRTAIDFDKMNDLAYDGKAIVASSFMPYKSLYWDESIPKPTHDVAKAKKLLAEAGNPDGFDLSLISVSGDTIQEAEAVVIQSSLAKVGINVKIDSYELTTAYDKEATDELELGFRYWTNDIIDPDEVATIMADANAESHASHSHWSGAKAQEASKLISKARSEADPKKREQQYRRIQELVNEGLPFIPLLYVPFAYAMSNSVSGFNISPMGTYRDSLLTLTVKK